MSARKPGPKDPSRKGPGREKHPLRRPALSPPMDPLEEDRNIWNSLHDMVIYQDLKGRLLWANKTARESSGLAQAELKGRFCHELWHHRQEPCPKCPMQAAFKTGQPVEEVLTGPDGRKWLVRGYPVRDSQGGLKGGIEFRTDITAHVLAEKALVFSHRFLEIANRHTSMKLLLDEFVSEMKAMTGCEAIGIRVLDEGKNIPYQSYTGFHKAFYEQENLICTESDQCMCAYVIRGEAPPELSFFSRGSFFLNSTSRFWASLSSRQKAKTRNICNRYGYESIALVPVRLGEAVLGLIHVADPRENMIPVELVTQLEEVAMQLGAAIVRIRAEEALRSAYGVLEERVRERTAELSTANARLRKKILEQKRTEEALKLDEARLEALHALNRMGERSLQEICDFAMEQGVRLTQSRYGYLFFMNEDETVLTVHSWSREALKICTVPGRPEVYAVKDTGLWGEAIRRREPVITNDYAASSCRKGIPEGHVPLVRHMNIPVFDSGRVVAVAGVANKAKPYVETDIRQLQLLMKGMWQLIQKKWAQESLKESEERLRFLTAQLITVQEKERKRIAIELHDELGQSLMTLKLHLRRLQKQLRNDQHAIGDHLEEIFLHIGHMTENIRRLSRDLSPYILEDLGLEAALGWLINESRRHHGMEIVYELGGIQELIDREQQILIFRILQEALTNVVKHAGASRIDISASRNDGRFSLVIGDNGTGFDVEKVLGKKFADRGLGLVAMDERVKMLQGSMEIGSRPGEGTRIMITLPVRGGGRKVETRNWKLETGTSNIERRTSNVQRPTWNLEPGTLKPET